MGKRVIHKDEVLNFHNFYSLGFYNWVYQVLGSVPLCVRLVSVMIMSMIQALKVCGMEKRVKILLDYALLEASFVLYF